MIENINEIWREIKDFEGLYMVSNFGRVKSLPRNTTKGKIIKPSDLRRYESIGLSKDGIIRKFLTHRLVAKAVNGDPSAINAVCKGKRKTSKGFLWRYS